MTHQLIASRDALINEALDRFVDAPVADVADVEMAFERYLDDVREAGLRKRSREERARELDRIRRAPFGAHRIVEIFDPELSGPPSIPEEFVERLIQFILDREYPEILLRRLDRSQFHPL